MKIVKIICGIPVTVKSSATAKDLAKLRSKACNKFPDSYIEITNGFIIKKLNRKVIFKLVFDHDGVL